MFGLFKGSKELRLVKAAMVGNLELVRQLLDEGVNVNAKDKYDRIALLAASTFGHTKVVKLLLDKCADVNAKNKDGITAGITALMVASTYGHAEVVKLLLDKGADINAKDEHGWTALMGASTNGHAEVVKLFLDKGADVNVKDKDGITPLLIAPQGRYKSATQLLESLKDLMRTTSEAWLQLENNPVKGELAAVMLLTATFNSLKEKVSVPFNFILADVKCLFPDDSAIQNLQKLNLGPPNRAFDVYDIPLVSEQFKEALTAIKYTIELLEQKSKDIKEEEETGHLKCPYCGSVTEPPFTRVSPYFRTCSCGKVIGFMFVNGKYKVLR